MTPAVKARRVASKSRYRGDIQIDIYHRRRGRDPWVETYGVRNTIVRNGLNSPLYLWSQDAGAVTDWRLVTLIPGRNATPPSPGDTALGDPLGVSDEIALLAANRQVSASTGELIITGTLLTTQGNGETLREIGLFMGSGDLFARQVHPAIDKDNTITIIYTWRIAVTS